jgi:hypothetical protein
VFTGGDSLQFRVSSSIGERLFGAAHYQGVLFFWKYPLGIFYLDDNSIDRYQWGVRTRSNGLGCAPSPHAVLEIDDDVLFCAPDGHFHLLSAVDTLGGTRDSDLTRMLGLQGWTQENLSVDGLASLVSVWDPTTKTGWFGVRSVEQYDGGLPDNDLIIRFDFSARVRGGPIRVSTSRNWTADSLCLKRIGFVGQQVVCIGEFNFNSQLLIPGQYGARTDFDDITDLDVTRGIPIQVVTPELELYELSATGGTRRKAFRALEVVAQRDVDDQDLTIELTVDGILRQTIVFPFDGDRRRLHTLQVGDGYAISATLRTSSVALDDLPLLGLIIYAEPFGTDHSRIS